ncbi:methyltransferase domain-containing protein [Candidatus Saccharibacteria bacterium]|nr:methyltransferase domain-containing protein [Candidatus Saccharibacteria bacterium]
MKYLAILGRQPEISMAELEALFGDKWQQISFPDGSVLAVYDKKSSSSFLGDEKVLFDINRLGGCLKFAIQIKQSPLEYLSKVPEGKITIGISDYSKNASRKTAQLEGLKLKKILVRHGRSVRVVENKEAVLSTATSLHNGLSGKNERKVELIKLDADWFRVVGVQDIEAYAKRDQARPARDAKVGMLPPKLAQILINLCGVIPKDATILDPFCGTGVVLQEALLMGYRAYGTDIDERMVQFSEKNLKYFDFSNYKVELGDATNYNWTEKIDAVACEGYLGKPFSNIPTEMERKEQKQKCKAIVLDFLKNLIKQIEVNTPVVIAVPAWLYKDNSYERLDILDDISDMGYNVDNKTRRGILYHRDGQVVARDILILRKK